MLLLDNADLNEICSMSESVRGGKTNLFSSPNYLFQGIDYLGNFRWYKALYYLARREQGFESP